MYVELPISNTLHKKTYRIGSGLCGTSEKSQKAKFAELLFHALRRIRAGRGPRGGGDTAHYEGVSPGFYRGGCVRAPCPGIRLTPPARRRTLPARPGSDRRPRGWRPPRL